jgi:ATP-dependent helicase/nuclease subunit B
MVRRTLAERERIARLLGEPPITYAAFVAELGGALDAARYGGEMPAHDKVAVLPFLAARGLTFEHVVILGAAEGEIPAALPAPPFYTRRERGLLAAAGAAPAPADPGDERSIFYEALCRARASLTFSYTRLDESGNELRPSPYLRAVAECFVAPLPTREIRAGSAPEPEEAASIQEQLIALAARDAELSDPALAASAELAAHIRRAAAIERWREGLGPHGPFEGLVEDEAALAELASRFGAGHRWSVTQINDFTICAYRFVAAHVLRLGARGDPEESLEQAGRGRLLHAILAEAGLAWSRLALPFDAAAEGPILDALDAAADKVLAVAPQVYGFEPGPFWPWEQAEAKATVARAVRRWLRDPRGWEGFRPAGVEAGFGMGTGLPALRLETPGGAALVIGRIDRVDQDEQGRLALIDYKSGGTPKALAEALEGWDVQLTVYSLAAEGLAGAGQQVAQAAALMIGSGKRGKALTAAERPQAEQALRERLGAAIAGSRAGAFPVRPSRECPPSCQFMAICRVNLAKRAG